MAKQLVDEKESVYFKLLVSNVKKALFEKKGAKCTRKELAQVMGTKDGRLINDVLNEVVKAAHYERDGNGYRYNRFY